MKPTLFVSDLHLCASRPRINRIFFDFLNDTAPHADALYVLGDLFEYWAGDDDLADPFHAGIVAALHGLSEQGVALYLMHGNRDFLIGRQFADACGATLLPDPVIVGVANVPTLLTHGDLLCTADRDYQNFRGKVRDPAWQQAFLARPLAERKAEIAGLRERSTRKKREKAAGIMDVTPSAVATLLRESGYPRLIHGHTHRPARHVHEIDGRRCERWVLRDWYDSGAYLHCDESGCAEVLIRDSG
ncbi:MAG: UDP-2,3-diacylglucosamine diphosphatase [Burkholderiales bacterium]|nr:UDP-2,3-diacylglucosamine diphosphatase [Pseudomonadota bacterium]